MFNGKKKKNSESGGRVNIYVRFQGQEGEPVPHYCPGDTILGVVNLEAQREIRTNRVDLELYWETQGRGDRNSEIVDRDHIPVGVLLPGEPVQHPFSFEAPRLPWTYEGELIRVVWHLKIQVDVQNALDLFNMMNISHKEPFVLRP